MTHLKKTKKLGIIMPKLGYSMPNAKYIEAKQKSAEIFCHNTALMSYALYPNVDGGLAEQWRPHYKDTAKKDCYGSGSCIRPASI